MEIRTRRNDLVKELQLVQGIVERKNSIPILSNVLAEAKEGRLSIAATDLDVSLRCGCEAEVKQAGSIALGAKKLYEIVRALPESEVKIKLKISVGISNYPNPSVKSVEDMLNTAIKGLNTAKTAGGNQICVVDH